MTARSRELRHHPNFPEAILWQELRGSRFAGFKFRRQHVVGMYIVDFYCARSGVVVELDGITHPDAKTPIGRAKHGSKAKA